MSKGRVLVTGGGGFIGSHVAERLTKEGREVRILDDLSTGHLKNVEAVRQLAPDRVDFVEGDIRDKATVATAMADVVEVVHLAALPSVPRSVHDPWTSHDVNVNGTIRLLEASRKNGVRRFVLAGSSSVYGDQPELPKRETMMPSPRSPYALSKLAAEQWVQLYAELYGLPGITLRYFNVFGPRQDPNSPYAAVIPLFLRALANGEPATIYGDGGQTRDFTYIDNVVEANLAALRCPPPNGEVVNIACGERTSVLELFDLICQNVGRRIEPVFEPPRVGDVRDSVAAIDRAKELLDFVPSVAMPEGITRTVASFATVHDF